MSLPSFPRRQRGLSLIAMLLFGVIAVAVITVGMRVLPTVLEYRAIVKTLNAVASSGATNAIEVQRAFERQSAIDDIVSIKGKDIVIDRSTGALVLSAAYEKRIPLFGPVSLLIEYEARSSLK